MEELLFFVSDTCVVCGDMLPKLENKLKRYPNINFQIINITKDKKTPPLYGVYTVPYLIYIIDGKEYIREGGAFSLELFFEKIDRLYTLKS